jgi:hypothetical protein
VEHAQWSLTVEGDGRTLAAAQRFARTAVNLISDFNLADAAALANDLPLPVGQNLGQTIAQSA